MLSKKLKIIPILAIMSISLVACDGLDKEKDLENGIGVTANSIYYANDVYTQMFDNVSAGETEFWYYFNELEYLLDRDGGNDFELVEQNLNSGILYVGEYIAELDGVKIDKDAKYHDELVETKSLYSELLHEYKNLFETAMVEIEEIKTYDEYEDYLSEKRYEIETFESKYRDLVDEQLGDKDIPNYY